MNAPLVILFIFLVVSNVKLTRTCSTVTKLVRSSYDESNHC